MRKTKEKKMSIQEIIDAVIQRRQSGLAFVPFASYDKDGDTIQVCLKDCSYYAEQLNPEITVFRAMHAEPSAGIKKEDIVGMEITGLNRNGKSVSIKRVIRRESKAIRAKKS